MNTCECCGLFKTDCVCGHNTSVPIGPGFPMTMIQQMFVSLTNNIICRVTLGSKFGVKNTDLIRKFMAMFTVFNIGSYIPWLSWVDLITGSIGRAEKVAKEFDELLEEVIEEHVNKKKIEDAKSDEDEEDFIDILLDLQKYNTTGFALHKDSLKALIVDVLVAGTEATHLALQWTMSELIKNPRVMKKLQQEVAEIAQGRSMIPRRIWRKWLILRLS
ncbi:putative cytochrome P450 [Helianthus annuus]|nr:putative cytochrome P450 [Helianthus annuus]